MIYYHMHSDYSLLDSCTKPQEYIDLVVEHGGIALSISEHGKPLNWTEKWKACRDAGIRYIHSVEIYLTEQLEPKVRDNYHTILMAKNMDGVKELNKLVSMSCDEEHFYYTNRISFDEFLNISDNIISTSACLASPLNKLPLDNEYYEKLVKKYTFLEIQPHNHPDQVSFNQQLWELSKKYNKKLIVGTDTHSSSEYKAQCRQVLLKAKHKSYGDEDLFDLSFKTEDEILEMFRIQGALPEQVYAEALSNTDCLYDLTEDIELDFSFKYPVLYGSQEEDKKIFSETVERKFKEKCERNIITEEQRPAFRDAIDEEMRVFNKLNMAGFMLAQSEIVCWCKDNGMTIGTARGSVGGSRVAYVTDIIDLNPETWHTVFSRFCNEDREELGDIDIDCIESDRPAIFKHIVERFGSNKTARVAAFGSLQDKAVIDEIGRALATEWDEKYKESNPGIENPYSLNKVADIKRRYEEDPEGTKLSDKTLFYFFDGLLGTKISQSIHPAGIVISPITLDDNYGLFNKEGERCLMLDMECVHEIGLVKYDFLILKTLQVLRDTCRYLGTSYPNTYEIDWNDEKVWENMAQSPAAIFQFEGSFAHESLRKFRPKNIFDLSLVTASIRPTGASYRDELLARKVHKNPSKMIDDLLQDSLGFLVYQEQTIAFLQQICGLSGSEADNVRRAIGRKQIDRLEAALPSILKGYCDKSDKPKEEAELEAKEFLQVIEDSASYQFGYNHSVAYCLISYLCAYYRYYHPLEFITSYLNNAANDDDIRAGTEYAKQAKIRITMPKWGYSRSDYYYDKDNNVIAKGLSSIKYMSKKTTEQLYNMSRNKEYTSFMDILQDIVNLAVIDARQLDILVKIDFFSEYGNQRELLYMIDIFFNLLKKGEAKKIKREKVENSPIADAIIKNSTCTNKNGDMAASYTICDMSAILREAESIVKNAGMQDLSLTEKVKNFEEVAGYVGFVTGVEEDRRKLFITDTKQLKRKKDGRQFGYSLYTKSIGSGVESRFTVFNRVYDKNPVSKGDIIYCVSYVRDGPYFTMTNYYKIN